MSDSLESLAGAVGAELVRHEPVDLDGVSVGATLTPADEDALSRAVSAISGAGLAAVPRGAGRHMGVGNPPSRADLFLSTTRIRGVLQFEPADGVCRARAGTPLSELRAAVLEAGWELPLDAPEDATLGGCLAVAAVGPRSLGYGPARDCVLGLDVVLGSGERTHCGGRVVKNVTGYDLAKLYTGSFGALGVITAAWLRLRPVPETTRVIALRPATLEVACERALLASRRVSTRACALRVGGADLEIVVELAGDVAAVAQDADAIGGEPAGADELSRIAARQWGLQDAALRRYRIAALPSELPGVLQQLHTAGLETIAHPGMGLVYACFGPEQDGSAVAAVSAAAPGPLRCEAAPEMLKRGGDVFGVSPQESRLFRALKQRFDPHGALSPGRIIAEAPHDRVGVAALV